MTSLGQSAAALGQQFANLTPFAAQARSALINLGAAAQTSQPSLVATQPLADRLKALGNAGAPSAANLQKLTASLDTTGGIDELMRLLFNGAVAGNGYDTLGHFVRDEPLVSSCTNFVLAPTPGCSANFAEATTAKTSSKDEQTLVAAAIAQMVQGGATDGRGTGSSDPVVSQAVKSTANRPGDGATLTRLLAFLTGSGK
jgi:hypothetical protein